MIAEGRSHLQSHVAAIGPWDHQPLINQLRDRTMDLDPGRHICSKRICEAVGSKHSKRVRSMAAPLHRLHHAAGVAVTLEVEEYSYVPGKENKFGKKNALQHTFELQFLLNFTAVRNSCSLGAADLMCGCVDVSPLASHGSIAGGACSFETTEVVAGQLAEPALEPCREDSPEITSPVVPFTMCVWQKPWAYGTQ